MRAVPVEDPAELADQQEAGPDEVAEVDEAGRADEGDRADEAGDAEPDAGDEVDAEDEVDSDDESDDESDDDEPDEDDDEDDVDAAQRLGTATDDDREAALATASLAVQRGELVVLPTDTVYGIGADAFDPDAVQALLDAKGRGRDMPPPVLISSATTLDALATGVPEYARRLVDRFWPGPLTIVCFQQASLQWDLGDTRGTVAVRMPDHRLALDLLERTGPLAVSSANLTGHPAATDADQAAEMLSDQVAVIIDDGPSPGGAASTIVDVRGVNGKLLRTGAISLEDLNEALDGLDATIEDED